MRTEKDRYAEKFEALNKKYEELRHFRSSTRERSVAPTLLNETSPTNPNHAMKLRLPNFNADPNDKPTKYLKALKKCIMATGLDFSQDSCVVSDTL